LAHIFYKALADFNLKNYDNALIMFLEHHKKNRELAWIVKRGNKTYDSGRIQKRCRSVFPASLRVSNRQLTADSSILSDIYLMLSIILYYENDYLKSESYLQKSTRSGNRSIAAQYLKHYYDSKTVEAH
jgi:tetratricopeptide (TPR) repeat protein